MTTDLASRVDAGARLLDQKLPSWYRGVALDELAMQSCDRCILGQIYGSYTEGCDSLGLDWGGQYGFDRLVYSAGGKDSDYPALADLWRAEIRKRLEAGS